MSKIIAIWGKSGSGISTTAVNLAVALSESGKLVTLMSTNLQHGDIQIFLNQTIPPDKGTHMALADDTGHPEGFLTPAIKINENLFIMAVPNQTETIFTDQLFQDKIVDLYQNLSMYADYLILDISDDINNALSMVGLTAADQIFTIYRCSQKSVLWYKSMHSLMVRARFDEKIMPVLSLSEIGVLPEDFIKATSIEFQMDIPNIDEAYIVKDTGEPIYLNRSKRNKDFISAIDQMKGLVMKS